MAHFTLKSEGKHWISIDSYSRNIDLTTAVQGCVLFILKVKSKPLENPLARQIVNTTTRRTQEVQFNKFYFILWGSQNWYRCHPCVRSHKFQRMILTLLIISFRIAVDNLPSRLHRYSQTLSGWITVLAYTKLVNSQRQKEMNFNWSKLGWKGETSEYHRISRAWAANESVCENGYSLFWYILTRISIKYQRSE